MSIGLERLVVGPGLNHMNSIPAPLASVSSVTVTSTRPAGISREPVERGVGQRDGHRRGRSGSLTRRSRIVVSSGTVVAPAIEPPAAASVAPHSAAASVRRSGLRCRSPLLVSGLTFGLS